MKIHEKFLLVLICVLLTLQCFGCMKKSAFELEDGIFSSDNYQVTPGNGGYQINFNDGNTLPHEPTCSYGWGSLSFASFSEMRRLVAREQMSLSLQASIKANFADNLGKIEICNMETIFVPKMPSGLYQKGKGVEWYGNRYTCFLMSMGGISGSYYCGTENYYAEQYQYKYSDFYTANTIDSEIALVDRNAVEYRYSTESGRYKRIRYTIEKTNTTLTVDEYYCLETEKGISSDTVPQSVTIYGVDDGVHFIYELRGFSSRPTLRWLSDFGVEQLEECQQRIYWFAGGVVSFLILFAGLLISIMVHRRKKRSLT